MGHLDDFEDLKACQSVCRLWRDEVSSYFRQLSPPAKIYLYHPNGDEEQQDLAEFPKHLYQKVAIIVHPPKFGEDYDQEMEEHLKSLEEKRVIFKSQLALTSFTLGLQEEGVEQRNHKTTSLQEEYRLAEEEVEKCQELSDNKRMENIKNRLNSFKKRVINFLEKDDFGRELTGLMLCMQEYRYLSKEEEDLKLETYFHFHYEVLKLTPNLKTLTLDLKLENIDSFNFDINPITIFNFLNELNIRIRNKDDDELYNKVGNEVIDEVDDTDTAIVRSLLAYDVQYYFCNLFQNNNLSNLETQIMKMAPNVTSLIVYDWRVLNHLKDKELMPKLDKLILHLNEKNISELLLKTLKDIKPSRPLVEEIQFLDYQSADTKNETDSFLSPPSLISEVLAIYRQTLKVLKIGKEIRLNDDFISALPCLEKLQKLVVDYKGILCFTLQFTCYSKN